MRHPVLPRLARRLASWQVLAVLVVLALVAGFAGVRAVQGKIRLRADENAVSAARMVSALTAERNIEVLADGLTTDAQSDLDADVAALRVSGQAVGLVIWSMDGRIVYADKGQPAGEARLPEDLRIRAADGPVVVTDGNDRAGTVEVLLPVDPDHSTIPEGIVEVILPISSINRLVTQSGQDLYIGVVVALVLLAFTLWRIRRRQRHLHHASRHDALTGLGNRTLLTERGGDLATGDQEGWSALLLIDLDGFKEINDTLGHDVGDQLLVAIGDALRAATRAGDTVARLGGDEFAVLIDRLPTPSSATEAAKHLLTELRRPVLVGGLSLEVEASVGIALAPDHGGDLATLLRCADVAMYQAKRDGSEIATYQRESAPDASPQLTLLAELRRALASEELRLFYQPKSTRDGRVTEVEALIRWEHPERGLLGPFAFMPLAERTAIIKPLTAWVMAEAARQCRAWRDSGLDLRIAVNISPRNLIDDELPDMVLAAASAAGIPVSMLEIEVTETAAMADPAKAIAILNRLHSMDVRVAIDDFGAGYTSLSYLTSLPVRCLKIDRQFITHLLDNPTDEAVVRHVIHLAHDLGMRSLAEGVEEPAIWARLADLGCDEIQGYVLTKPLPPEELVAWLHEWRANWPVFGLPNGSAAHSRTAAAGDSDLARA